MLQWAKWKGVEAGLKLQSVVVKDEGIVSQTIGQPANPKIFSRILFEGDILLKPQEARDILFSSALLPSVPLLLHTPFLPQAPRCPSAEEAPQAIRPPSRPHPPLTPTPQKEAHQRGQRQVDPRPHSLHPQRLPQCPLPPALLPSLSPLILCVQARRRRRRCELASPSGRSPPAFASWSAKTTRPRRTTSTSSLAKRN